MKKGTVMSAIQRLAKPPLLPIMGVALLATIIILVVSGPEPEQEQALASIQAPLNTLPPKPTEPQLSWKEGQFGKRPFYNQLMDLGLSGGKIHSLINTLTPVYDFRRSHPRHSWRLGFDGQTPVQFTLNVSPSEIYDVLGVDGEQELVRRDIKVMVRPTVVRGVIEDSLFQSLSGANQASALAARLEKVFAWDIDFYTDPRKGDSFEILVEETFIEEDGEPVFNGYGDILAAQYHSDKTVVDAFLFELNGEEGYYSSNGKSLVRDFLRSPLKLQYVTSSFSKKRFHPILKRYKAHNGVDYRAGKNTPVMAVASGTIVHAGRKGSAGIAVEIKHRNSMLTQYFHLNKVARGVRSGVRVKQGQLIGYVGKTGYATSYHLHFGMKIRNKYVDPQRQRFEPGTPIPAREMDRFRNQMDAYVSQFQSPSETVMVKKAPYAKPKKI